MGGEVEEEAAWVTNGKDERMDAPAAKKDRRVAVWCRTTVDDFGGEVTMMWLLLLGEYNVKAVTAVLDSDRTAAVGERSRLPDFVMVKIKRDKAGKGSAFLKTSNLAEKDFGSWGTITQHPMSTNEDAL